MTKAKAETDLKQFIDRQRTIPAPEEESLYPYSEYWVKAVLYILLSGRVKTRTDGYPNKTDTDRVCRQANFNTYLFEDVAKLLIKSSVVIPKDKFDTKYYHEGKNFKAFLNHDTKMIQVAAKRALLEFVQEYTGYQVHRPTFAMSSNLEEFLMLFFECFKGKAILQEDIGKTLLEFSKLPKGIFLPLKKKLGIKGLNCWESWLDEKGQQALLSALYITRWAYVTEEKGKDWIFLNNTGRIMLGLCSAPPPPPACTEFKALSNLSVLAGCDLPARTLVPLFRYGKIVRIDRVFEFRFDKKIMQEVPSETSAGKELLKALQQLEPLPSTIRAFLGDKRPSEAGGVLRVGYCSAIVIPENPEMLHVIRQHPKLKGYIAPKSPKGTLIIKHNSNADNFFRRCEEYGFKLKLL
ncbi:MAG: hypothetical protein K8F52_15130 [Candidatus Scalindua rubra]|uniref:Helicase XPB/Ssl2 N-terminal domain-containing protein n=1 Tax=Candidatus Scalindua brodae TaxID=237368 RepID=A0A0B0EN88_9BACT|nr:MAG: hypothetical protein SCABRO_00756 [Candidatus Scalindua brodae]MBZ0109984.1 hypothetical protein [Candidatus Scalindua rubra]